ncbi:MAG: Gfo/Idh/MocA family oxidoreductase [Candidatus Omnitrophota bacterium]
MEKIKLAVIGVGHLGMHHARIYSHLKNATLVGVCDIDERKAKRIARANKTCYYTDYRELIGKINAASVVVPTKLHHKIAKDLLANNINVLIEKPMTTTLQEADELLKLAELRSLTLQVGHVERFNAAVRAIQDLATGPRFIECHRLGPFSKRGTDVGVVLDLMIHDIDIILGLVNSPIEKIDAIGVSVLTPHEDIANARITFRNKAVADLTASRLTPEAQRKIRIFVEDAYISLDYVKQLASIYRKEGGRIAQRMINIKKEEPLKKELESFVECVHKKTKPLVSGREGRDALAVALDIIDRIKNQK